MLCLLDLYLYAGRENSPAVLKAQQALKAMEEAFGGPLASSVQTSYLCCVSHDDDATVVRTSDMIAALRS